MDNPKVSILIPTYNYAKFLPDTLDSILVQDFQDYEVIISDDASTDNTVEVVKAYLEKDARIKFFRQVKNLGMVENWNWCLNKSQGEYVKYLFADDMLASNKALTIMVQMLDDNPSAAMAVADRYFIDSDSRVIGLGEYLGKEGLISGAKAIMSCLLSGHNLIGEPTVVLFRKVFSARGFDPRYRQLVDLEMWFHFCVDHDFVYTRQPLCAFRRHQDQQTEVNYRSQKTELESLRIFQGLINSRSICIGLYKYYRVLFLQLKNIKRTDELQGEQLQELAVLKKTFPRRWYVLCWIQYRLFRPFKNLRRSLRKRRDRRLAMKKIRVMAAIRNNVSN